MTKKWTNFAKLACHFPGSDHLSFNRALFERYCMCYHGKEPNFTIDSHRVGQLEDHGWSRWTAFPTHSLALHKFHCQTLQAVGSGQIHDFQHSSELGELRGHRKTTCKWTVCSEAHQGEEEAACQCGNGQWSRQLDKKMPKIWEFTTFMLREFLNEKGWSITKKIYQSGLKRPETRQKKPSWKLMIWMPEEPSIIVHAVMDDESYFVNIYTAFGRFIWISWQERCQGGWKTKLTQRRSADGSGRKKSLREINPRQNVVRLVMLKVMSSCGIARQSLP